MRHTETVKIPVPVPVPVPSCSIKVQPWKSQWPELSKTKGELISEGPCAIELWTGNLVTLNNNASICKH